MALPLRSGGDLFAAEQVLGQVAADALDSGDAFAAVTLLGDQALLQIAQGKLHQAYSISQQAIQIAEHYQLKKGYPLPAIAYVYPRLSRVLLEWNDLPGAVAYAQSGIKLCRGWGSLGLLMDN